MKQKILILFENSSFYIFNLRKCLSLNTKDQPKMSNMRFAAEWSSSHSAIKAEPHFELIFRIERFHLSIQNNSDRENRIFKHDH